MGQGPPSSTPIWGDALDPHACFLLERGLKTLPIAGSAAEFDRSSTGSDAEPNTAGSEEGSTTQAWSRILGHGFATRLFSGFGGMLSFYLEDAARAETFLNRVAVSRLHAASLGGVETLVVQTLPQHTSWRRPLREGRKRLGITDDLVRVSVGNRRSGRAPEADFEQALEAE